MDNFQSSAECPILAGVWSAPQWYYYDNGNHLWFDHLTADTRYFEYGICFTGNAYSIDSPYFASSGPQTHNVIWEAHSSFYPSPVPPIVDHPIAVTIDGPTVASEHAGNQCVWTANVTDGAGPMSYVWRWNGEVVGFGAQWWGDTGTSGTAFLDVTVNDHYYDSAWAGIQVQVVPFTWCP